jgi:hypothetical protein
MQFTGGADSSFVAQIWNLFEKTCYESAESVLEASNTAELPPAPTQYGSIQLGLRQSDCLIK